MSTFGWHDFLILARQLDGDSAAAPHQDARARTIVSRAYYAAYHAVCAAAKADGFVPPPVDGHWALVGYCQRHNRREWQNLGVQLGRLRKDRTDADYSRSAHPWEHLRANALATAKTICVNAEQLRTRGS